MRDQSPEGHGTSVASIAVGKGVGVAKNAKFIGVKFYSNATYTIPEDLVECWNWIMDDVDAKNRVGKATIIMSWSEYSFFP